VTEQEQLIRLITDEADAVLAILDRRRQGTPLDESDWRRLFDSEGYRRLAQREEAMNVPVTDGEFQAFCLSDKPLQELSGLRESLQQYASLDLGSLTEEATAYLPPEASLHGTIYPVIKSRSNSFVFELTTNPAMFMALKPGERREKLENTLIHELHHWGMASLDDANLDPESLEPSERPHAFAKYIIGAFGEGFAMLAAAGGPDVHPHETSETEERDRWDQSMEGFDDDLKSVERYLLDVLDGTYESREALIKAAMPFFGIQGPWYTVGWKMAQMVEERRGRDVLFECMRDPRKLLSRYNEVADSSIAWSDGLLERLGTE